MNDEELRGLIRDSIARHLGGGSPSLPAPPNPRVLLDPSHGLLPLASGGDSSGACLIEPSVPCTHCGYCKSFGH